MKGTSSFLVNAEGSTGLVQVTFGSVRRFDGALRISEFYDIARRPHTAWYMPTWRAGRPQRPSVVCPVFRSLDMHVNGLQSSLRRLVGLLMKPKLQCLLPPRRRLWDQYGSSVCNQLMSLKLGVMIGPTSRENWLTFGGDRSWMLDHFPTSLTIAEYRIFIARQHTHVRYWYSKFVCPSVRYVPVSDENGLIYRHSFFYHTVARSL